jgi:hypothetical protein
MARSRLLANKRHKPPLVDWRLSKRRRSNSRKTKRQPGINNRFSIQKINRNKRTGNKKNAAGNFRNSLRRIRARPRAINKKNNELFTTRRIEICK